LRNLPKRGDMEKWTLPKLAKRGLLKAYIFDGTWLTINMYKDLIRVRKYFR